MKYAVRCGWHIGDILMQFPALKYLADQGHKVYAYSLPQYKDVFSLISYAEWVRDPNEVAYDRHLDLQLYQHPGYFIGKGGLRPCDYIYLGMYPDLVPAVGRPIILDRQDDIDFGGYGLPERYNLISPFGYSQRFKPTLDWMIQKAISLFGTDDNLFILSDKNVPESRYRTLVAKKLSHLPWLIRKASEFFTTNSSPALFASVVRRQYYHLHAPEFDGLTDWLSRKRVMVYHEDWPRAGGEHMSITMPRTLLERHCNPVFIETGTYQGDAVQLALDLGFKEIHSIEIDPQRYNACVQRFKGNPKVHLHLGDSAKVFPGIVDGLKEKATIWLDAHAIGAHDPNVYAGERWPLKSELESLAKTSGRRDHTILIDDRHDYALFGLTEEDVYGVLRKINPAYKFHFEDSISSHKDLLVVSTEEIGDPSFYFMYNPGGPGSGLGSTPEYTEDYRRFLEGFLKEHQIKSVLDVGCGDWQSTRLINWGDVRYHGVDVVPVLIERLRKTYGGPNRMFSVINALDPEIPEADLIITKDVMQHLPNRTILSIIPKLTKAAKHILWVNDKAPKDELNNTDIPSAGYRTLDLSRPPFSLSGKIVFEFKKAPHFKVAFWQDLRARK